VAGLAATFGSGAMTNSVPGLESETTCYLVTGSNTTEQHPIIGTRIMQAKEERDAKLIVVDPRRIQLAELADVYLQPRPGTNVAWLNGLMHVIIEEGLEDKEFIQERTEGFEELKKVVAGYTPERVEEISGIPAADLVAAARMYAQADRAAILYAMGITQHTGGTHGVMSCANLAMLTGNVGKPGTGVNPLRGQNNVQGACDMGGLPNVFPGYQRVTDPEIRAKFAAAWEVEDLPGEVGLTVTEMTNGALEGTVKAMYIVGENPMVSDPDINHVRAGLQALDFLVVQDIFMTPTAELAHVVLPAASYVEKDGTFTGTDRRIQRIRAAIPPVGQSKPDWQIVCELAKRVGAPGRWNYEHPGEIMDEIASLTPIYGGVSYERLEKLGGLQWPCPAPDHPGTPYLHKGKFSRGLGLFKPAEYKPPAEEPDEEYPLLLTTGRTMFHFHTGTMTRRSEKLVKEVPLSYLEVSPADAESLGLRHGQMVHVSSRRGELDTQAFVTPRVPEGVVFMPFHFAEAAANVLTNRALDPLCKIPELKVCAVRVGPAA
jgi:formate dehydrogenase alpha subunit